MCSLEVAVVSASSELDALFVRLQTTTDPEIAQQVETNIWQHWRNDTGPATLECLQDTTAVQASHGPLPALGHYDYLLELTPHYVHGLNARATLLYSMAEYDASMQNVEAVLALEEVRRLHPHAGGLDWTFERLDPREQSSENGD